MLAYDYPLLNLFWTMLIFFLWIAWFFLLFRVIADIFRSHDMGGFAKALWIIFVIFLPFLGIFVYLIARGHSMQERSMREAQHREAEFRSYVQQTAGGTAGTAEELARFAELHEQGVLTDAEFEQAKARALA